MQYLTHKSFVNERMTSECGIDYMMLADYDARAVQKFYPFRFLLLTHSHMYFEVFEFALGLK